MIKDIECLFYSLQGPIEEKNKNETTWFFCLIFNDKFYQSFEKAPGGKKLLMSIAVSYFQERLQADRNPLLKQFNPELHGKLAYYVIEKMSIEISDKKYKYGKDTKPSEFLLEKDVDTKER